MDTTTDPKSAVKRSRVARFAALGIALAAAFASSAVQADRGHRHGGPNVRFGVYIGVPYGRAWYPPPRYYYYPSYYPPVLVAPAVVAAPPVYIEQGQGAQVQNPAPPAEAWWYYCREASAYYPYVKDCPGGWQKVSPHPAPG